MGLVSDAVMLAEAAPGLSLLAGVLMRREGRDTHEKVPSRLTGHEVSRDPPLRRPVPPGSSSGPSVCLGLQPRPAPFRSEAGCVWSPLFLPGSIRLRHGVYSMGPGPAVSREHPGPEVGLPQPNPASARCTQNQPSERLNRQAPLTPVGSPPFRGAGAGIRSGGGW